MTPRKIPVDQGMSRAVGKSVLESALINRQYDEVNALVSEKKVTTTRYNLKYIRPSFLCSAGFGRNQPTQTRASMADLVHRKIDFF